MQPSPLNSNSAPLCTQNGSFLPGHCAPHGSPDSPPFLKERQRSQKRKDRKRRSYMTPSPLSLFPKGAQAMSRFFLLKGLLKRTIAWAPTIKTALKGTQKDPLSFSSFLCRKNSLSKGKQKGAYSYGGLHNSSKRNNKLALLLQLKFGIVPKRHLITYYALKLASPSA